MCDVNKKNLWNIVQYIALQGLIEFLLYNSKAIQSAFINYSISVVSALILYAGYSVIQKTPLITNNFSHKTASQVRTQAFRESIYKLLTYFEINAM